MAGPTVAATIVDQVVNGDFLVLRDGPPGDGVCIAVAIPIVGIGITTVIHLSIGIAV